MILVNLKKNYNSKDLSYEKQRELKMPVKNRDDPSAIPSWCVGEDSWGDESVVGWLSLSKMLLRMKEFYKTSNSWKKWERKNKNSVLATLKTKRVDELKFVDKWARGKCRNSPRPQGREVANFWHFRTFLYILWSRGWHEVEEYGRGSK